MVAVVVRGDSVFAEDREANRLSTKSKVTDAVGVDIGIGTRAPIPNNLSAYHAGHQKTNNPTGAHCDVSAIFFPITRLYYYKSNTTNFVYPTALFFLYQICNTRKGQHLLHSFNCYTELELGIVLIFPIIVYRQVDHFDRCAQSGHRPGLSCYLLLLSLI